MAERILKSKAAGSVAVLGHEAEAVRDALSGLEIKTAENLDYATGLASSLKAGIRALPPDAAGALVALSDMPGVKTADLDRLIDAFIAAGGKAIVRATHNGKRGNPVILPRALFAEVERLEGDTGARQIVESAPLDVIDVELGEAASLDVDTPDALRAAGGVLTEG
jgi:molybdenum cofactor cytidylyltransferase